MVVRKFCELELELAVPRITSGEILMNANSPFVKWPGCLKSCLVLSALGEQDCKVVVHARQLLRRVELPWLLSQGLEPSDSFAKTGIGRSERRVVRLGHGAEQDTPVVMCPRQFLLIQIVRRELARQCVLKRERACIRFLGFVAATGRWPQ